MEAGKDATDAHAHFVAQPVDKGLLADVYPATVNGTCRHNLFGWRFNDRLTVDENFMDLAALAARNSLCTGGHMGCVLVKDGDIMAISTNTPLFQPYASDVHAEVNAVSGCARHGLATAGSTAYITMPPCKHCFMVLQAAGIQRIVSRHGTLLETCTQAAAEIGIEWGIVKDDAQSDSRRAAYVQAAQQADPEYHAAVAAHRLARKQAKKDAYAARERRKKGTAAEGAVRGDSSAQLLPRGPPQLVDGGSSIHENGEAKQGPEGAASPEGSARALEKLSL